MKQVIDRLILSIRARGNDSPPVRAIHRPLSDAAAKLARSTSGSRIARFPSIGANSDREWHDWPPNERSISTGRSDPPQPLMIIA